MKRKRELSWDVEPVRDIYDRLANITVFVEDFGHPDNAMSRASTTSSGNCVPRSMRLR